jgi:glycosyltransferase involved in cell wall biosynthesis
MGMRYRQPVSILHLITTLDTGGAEMMLSKLFAHMNRDDFMNHVLSLTGIGPVGRKIIAQGIPVYSLNMPRGRLNIGGMFKLWRIIRFLRPTILQTWLYHADLLGLVFGRLAGVKFVCWNIRCSEMDLYRYRPGTRITVRLCAMLSSFPDVVIANSKEGADFHKRMGYKAKRWELIPNGFDLGVFKPDRQAKERLARELGLNHKEPPIFAGYIARFDPMKDHPTFIRAACLLLRERRDVHFILAGKDVNEENKALAAQIPDVWKDHFHLLGERDDIPTVAAGLDIATLTSYGEGFPNTIGEAMSCGVPCVVTDVGDSARIVGDTGRVVPPRDPSALARACMELIEMGQRKRYELGMAARERILRNFELTRIVKDYEALYSSLLQ